MWVVTKVFYAIFKKQAIMTTWANFPEVNTSGEYEFITHCFRECVTEVY